MATKRGKRSTSSSARRRGGDRPRRRRASPAAAAAATASAYRLSDAEIEHALRAGTHQPVLEEYFGPRELAELQQLAREAAATRALRGAPPVLILPGIMGSKLGIRHALLDDVIWIDPIDLVVGRLRALALDSGVAIEPLGVILLAYLKLKLRLRIAGFDARFHPFDWRQSIDGLGRELLAAVKAVGSGVQLVAHSMGGLVARAAIARDGERRISRLIMLGTPNHGSFSPVQALRATHETVRQVAAVDLRSSPEELSRKVFRTFPGLLQMLPSAERFSAVDLYDPAAWPPGPGPDPVLLAKVRAVQDGLAPADDRFHLVVGVNRETVTGLRRAGNEFEYETSLDGDGTVPRAFCELAGASQYYVEERHGSLANNGRVERAVIDILDTGATTALARTAPPLARAGRTVRERALRARPFDGRRGAAITRDEARHLLDAFVSPDGLDGALPRAAGAAPEASDGPPGDFTHPIAQVIVARRRQRPLEICLAQGSITEVRTRAYVLGVFKEVDPRGPASSIDAHLDGAVREFTTRRMFSANVGEVFALPSGRHRLFADFVLLAGLGPFDAFASETQEFVTENIVRACARTNVEELATVLLGAGSGMSVETSVRHHLVGFLHGLRDADRGHRVRRITLCEIDPARYQRIKQEVYRLASTTLFDDVQITFDETVLPAPVEPPAAARAAAAPGAGRVAMAYLDVRQEANDGRRLALRSSLLTAGARATVLTGVRDLARRELDAQIARIEGPGFTAQGLAAYGRDLGELALSGDVIAALREMEDCHLVVVHDAVASRVPWETLHVGDWSPAAGRGLSRRYLADNLSVAKWLEQRRQGDTLEILLVVDPTGDLPGAELEAGRLEKIFPSSSKIRLTRIATERATRAALMQALRSGRYDVMHYAGHASFNPRLPSASGIVCADGVLSGADLAGLSKLPAVVFFNACESARIRGARGAAARRRALWREARVGARIDHNVGLAEAFLRGGVANYLGTYWPVEDAAAATFAETFYTALTGGESIGQALTRGRAAVRALGSVDWADYVHYGSYDFAVKGLGRQADFDPAATRAPAA